MHFIATDAYHTDRQQQKESWQKTAKRMEAVSLFIQKHRIYLPEGICELLQKVADEMYRHVTAAGIYAPLNPQTQEMIAEQFEALIKAYDAFFSESIPAAMKLLEDEFRNLLGVGTSRSASKSEPQRVRSLTGEEQRLEQNVNGRRSRNSDYAGAFGNKTTQDKSHWDLRNGAMLAIPSAILGMVLKELYLGDFFALSPSALIHWYGVFLFVYSYWVFWSEYTACFNLHKLKSPVVDTLLVFGIFLPLREFNRKACWLTSDFWWICLFLSILCIWEIYTMVAGRNTYFVSDRIKARGTPWLMFLGMNLWPLRSPEGITRWAEYSYWLIVDSFGALSLTFYLWYFRSHCRNLPQTASVGLLCFLGLLIGVVHIYRYIVYAKVPPGRS